MVQRESFIFIITCESVGTVDSMRFPWQQQSAQVHRPNEAVKQLGFAFLCYLKQGARSLSFFTTAADPLQVTIAFVLKIFFL